MASKNTSANRRRYVVQRTLLILIMGSKCAYCPERRPWKLEFHHTVKSANGHAGKTSRHQRIRWYMREWLDGTVVLACGKCNKKLGVPPAPNESEIPF